MGYARLQLELFMQLLDEKRVSTSKRRNREDADLVRENIEKYQSYGRASAKYYHKVSQAQEPET